MPGRSRIFVLVGAAAFLAWLNLRAPSVGVVDVVKATERGAALTNAPQGQSPDSSHAKSPGQMDRPLLEPADRDPFGLVAPKPVVVVQQAQPQPAQAALPPPPAPPPVNMVFAGRMTAPDGNRIVYVAYGDISLPITAGQNLPNGYRVDAITERVVELSYPPLNTTARLDLPALPTYEIR